MTVPLLPSETCEQKIMAPLAALILLPLAAIGLQLSFGLHGAMNSLYKLCFLIPPLVYCRTQGIGVFNDILKFRNWRRCLGVALGLAIFAITVF